MQLLRLLALFIPISAMFGAITNLDTFHWSGKIPSGQMVEIKAVNGGIFAEPTEGGAVEVIAYKTGHYSDPSEVRVQVVEHDNGVTVCAVYPSGLGGENSCQPGGGPAALPGSDVKVDFMVRVPRGVRFIGRTVNGQVEASRLQANAEAHTVNGNIRLSTSGNAMAETVNGNIRAELGRFAEPARFTTVNGGITLEVPRTTHAEVHAHTVNGMISTNLPLAIHGRLVNRHADGRIGHGGPSLKVATVNGSICLRQSANRKL